MLIFFDEAADPGLHPLRRTWIEPGPAGHTMAFCATATAPRPVGPGVGEAVLRGCLLLFPARAIPDVWQDERLRAASSPEERLLAAACLHGEASHLAVVSSRPPRQAWEELAAVHGKHLVHVALDQFAAHLVEQLRVVHVLNGYAIRAYAAQFFRAPSTR